MIGPVSSTTGTTAYKEEKGYGLSYFILQSTYI